ncbi:MAG: hypothetical protein K2X82_08395 [Gemmataceae bacterium]|nr:hypothetical protein [Gemmataceae bacterium]
MFHFYWNRTLASVLRADWEMRFGPQHYPRVKVVRHYVGVGQEQPGELSDKVFGVRVYTRPDEVGKPALGGRWLGSATAAAVTYLLFPRPLPKSGDTFSGGVFRRRDPDGFARLRRSERHVTRVVAGPDDPQVLALLEAGRAYELLDYLREDHHPEEVRIAVEQMVQWHFRHPQPRPPGC